MTCSGLGSTLTRDTMRCSAEWLGYVGTVCGQILLIEDVEDEQRVIKPEQACPACLAALEREQ